MKVSVKLNYACRVLAQLADAFVGEPWRRVEDLATIEAVPANYLVQILNDLRHAGLVVSRRGTEGGYALARAPEVITLYDIVRAVEADVLEFGGPSAGQSGEEVRRVWSEVKSYLETAYKSHTLASLVPERTDFMYHI